MNDEWITSENIKEVISINEDSEVTSVMVLFWVEREEAQRAQSAVLNDIRNAKSFGPVKSQIQVWAMLTPPGPEKTKVTVKDKDTVVVFIPQDRGLCKERHLQ